jgi:hypothetical protein
MRSSLTMAVALAAASCAHPGSGGPSTLAGHLGNVWFDTSSVTGSSVALSRGTDGHWRGSWGCGSEGGWCSGEVLVHEDTIEVQGMRFGLSFTPRYVVVHHAYLDLLLRRSDGGPVPRALVVPLWLAYQFAPADRPTPSVTSRPEPPVPEGRCLDVNGLGQVQLIVLPGGAASYDIEVEDGCRFRFLQRVARRQLGGPHDPLRPPDLTTGGAAR